MTAKNDETAPEGKRHPNENPIDIRCQENVAMTSFQRLIQRHSELVC